MQPFGRPRALTTMVLSPSFGAAELGADPFRERSLPKFSLCKQILGARFRFDSNSNALLGLVSAAYGDLPEHGFAMTAPEIHVELQLLPPREPAHTLEPLPVRMHSGAGMVCGVMDASNYVVLAPGQRQALVVASEDMLSCPYHLRYELIEFAVFVLATRAQGLVPLHAACVGRRGRGVLLLGASGSGKSTLTLCSLLQGLELLAEDAIFVQPQTMLATGVANYLHVRADTVQFVEDEAARRWLNEAPRIRRRSGVEKSEADLRLAPGALAPSPLSVRCAVFVSSQIADYPDQLLSRMPPQGLAERLAADQSYAAGQPGWQRFAERLTHLGVYELRRGTHPRASVDALRALLG